MIKSVWKKVFTEISWHVFESTNYLNVIKQNDAGETQSPWTYNNSMDKASKQLHALIAYTNHSVSYQQFAVNIYSCKMQQN